jgi:polysaccharide export outer membrane protein
MSTVVAQAAEYTLKKGDVISVSVWGEPDLEKEIDIREDGTVSFPLIGSVEAENLTLKELDDKITWLLKRDYLVNPDVTVSIPQKQFFITGEVKRPGAYTLTGKIGPLQAVTLAGGLTDFASSRVKIIRQEGGKEQIMRVRIDTITDDEGTIQDEYIIRPNDVIIVPRSFF